MAKKAEDRRFIRSVLSRVHPDLFHSSVEEQQVNTESLKLLHQTIEKLSQGKCISPLKLRFFVRDDAAPSGSRDVSAELSESLVPLYEAVGVITPEEAKELRSQEGRSARGLHDVSFLDWLASTVQEASVTAAELATRKQLLRDMTRGLVSRFGLDSLVCGAAGGASIQSVSDVRVQVEALSTVQDALEEDTELASSLRGLPLVVHPKAWAPSKDYAWVDPATGELRTHTSHAWADVAESGAVEVVAARGGVAERLRALDTTKARALHQLTLFWRKRRDALSKSAAAAIGVQFVWPDEGVGDQAFCLWAGRVAQDARLREALAGARYSFNVLVHADDRAPAAAFLSSCSTLQVHHRASPRQLAECLLSSEAVAAHTDHARRLEGSAEEAALLSAAKNALGAAHVVRICSREHAGAVVRALRRLIDNAPELRRRFNFAGVCLAIDDNYHLWDSGYVSIPYDFGLDTLHVEVTRLLCPTATPDAAAATVSSGPAEAEVAAAEQTIAADEAVPEASVAAAAASVRDAECAGDALEQSEMEGAEGEVAAEAVPDLAAPGGGSSEGEHAADSSAEAIATCVAASAAERGRGGAPELAAGPVARRSADEAAGDGGYGGAARGDPMLPLPPALRSVSGVGVLGGHVASGAGAAGRRTFERHVAERLNRHAVPLSQCGAGPETPRRDAVPALGAGGDTGTDEAGRKPAEDMGTFKEQVKELAAAVREARKARQGRPAQVPPPVVTSEGDGGRGGQAGPRSEPAAWPSAGAPDARHISPERLQELHGARRVEFEVDVAGEQPGGEGVDDASWTVPAMAAAAAGHVAEGELVGASAGSGEDGAAGGDRRPDALAAGAHTRQRVRAHGARSPPPRGPLSPGFTQRECAAAVRGMSVGAPVAARRGSGRRGAAAVGTAPATARLCAQRGRGDLDATRSAAVGAAAGARGRSETRKGAERGPPAALLPRPPLPHGAGTLTAGMTQRGAPGRHAWAGDATRGRRAEWPAGPRPLVIGRGAHAPRSASSLPPRAGPCGCEPRVTQGGGATFAQAGAGGGRAAAPPNAPRPCRRPGPHEGPPALMARPPRPPRACSAAPRMQQHRRMTRSFAL